MSVGKFIAGFGVGIVLGAIAGVLLAPEEGKETREKLAKYTSEMAKNTDETVKDIKEKAEHIVTDAQEKSEEIINKLQNMLGKKEETEA